MAITEHRPGRIFLSYRRADAQHLAGRLFDRLEARFGSGNVFMDVDSIEPGLDFGEAIDAAVSSCDVLLAVIGPGWLGSIDEHHRRRLDDPDDLVVLEIATALRRNVRVIPVLVEGVASPRREDLPQILAPLARRQAVRLDHVSFNATLTTLLAALERALATVPTNAGHHDGGHADEDNRMLSARSPDRLASPTRRAVTAATPSPARLKPAAYTAFWTAMLDRIRTEHPDWTNSRSPGNQNWFSMPSPFRGETLYVLNFGRHHELRSELYIDHTDPARAAAIYAALHELKDRIDQSFGEQLRL